jgi:hypothetical protein
MKEPIHSSIVGMFISCSEFHLKINIASRRVSILPAYGGFLQRTVVLFISCSGQEDASYLLLGLEML